MKKISTYKLLSMTLILFLFLNILVSCDNKYTVLSPPADLAEKNASFWTYWAEDDKAITVMDDTSIKVKGDASIKATFTGAFDNFIRYTAGPNQVWDLSKIRNIRFSIMTENNNENAFQNVSIKIGNKNKFFMWQGPAITFTQARGSWRDIIIPVTGNSEWEYFNTWGANLSRISFFELHADTWGYEPFTIWIDNISFELNP